MKENTRGPSGCRAVRPITRTGFRLSYGGWVSGSSAPGAVALGGGDTMQAGTEQGWACTRVARNAGREDATRGKGRERTQGDRRIQKTGRSVACACACPGRDATPRGRHPRPVM